MKQGMKPTDRIDALEYPDTIAIFETEQDAHDIGAELQERGIRTVVTVLPSGSALLREVRS